MSRVAVAGGQSRSDSETVVAPPPDAVRGALADYLLAIADDEFVIGFADSEWTGIAPILEEDIAMSSLAQDELGHAAALYRLLGQLVPCDPDAIAYDRPPEAYRHARLLDHPRGDWATAIVRRWLYDTADGVRIDALRSSSWRPLADLATLIAREERYHRLHVGAWIERLAGGGHVGRDRLDAAWAALAPDAATVLAPLLGEAGLVHAGILPLDAAALDRQWRAEIAPVLVRTSLAPPPAWAEPTTARLNHGEAFRALHAEFTSVRRLEDGVDW